MNVKKSLLIITIIWCAQIVKSQTYDNLFLKYPSGTLYFREVSANDKDEFKISEEGWDIGLGYHHYTSHKFYVAGIEKLKISTTGVNFNCGVNFKQIGLSFMSTLYFRSLDAKDKEQYKISEEGWNIGLAYHHYTGHKFYVAGSEKMRIGNNGIVDIFGTLRAQEVKVCLNQGCDFVFDKDYKLLSIEELDNFIKQNKHLPDIASATKMENEGINLGEMNAKLLQKIEEQSLYIIELNKRLTELENQMKIQ